jgi:hypothetical protein
LTGYFGLAIAGIFSNLTASDSIYAQGAKGHWFDQPNNHSMNIEFNAKTKIRMLDSLAQNRLNVFPESMLLLNSYASSGWNGHEVIAGVTNLNVDGANKGVIYVDHRSEPPVIKYVIAAQPVPFIEPELSWSWASVLDSIDTSAGMVIPIVCYESVSSMGLIKTAFSDTQVLVGNLWWDKARVFARVEIHSSLSFARLFSKKVIHSLNIPPHLEK